MQSKAPPSNVMVAGFPSSTQPTSLSFMTLLHLAGSNALSLPASTTGFGVLWKTLSSLTVE